MTQKICTEDDLRQRKELIQQVIDKLENPSFLFRLKSIMQEDIVYCTSQPVKVIPLPVTKYA